MTRQEYDLIRNHMLALMQDSAHDPYHIDRVLYAALDIAAHEHGVDEDVLIAACLLHDIGRERQFESLGLCHAQIGGEMALEFLAGAGWSLQKASHVRDCISSHRYRGDNPPRSLEAKILFDADKLDASGAVGIARSLMYEGRISEPLYILDDEGNPLISADSGEKTSFFQEYHYKLKKVYAAFHTERARQIAAARQNITEAFYQSLYGEVTNSRKVGEAALELLRL